MTGPVDVTAPAASPKRSTLTLNMLQSTRGNPGPILVFRKLQPLWTLLSNPRELVDVWNQCIACHYGLWKGTIHHRDISPTNLMYYRKDGKVMGVVTDFNLSTPAGSEHEFGNKRTGTIPFMAIELLRENGQNGSVTHMYLHEVESLIWSFAWISCQCKEDGSLRKGSLRQLGNVDPIRCAEKKLLVLYSVPEIDDEVDKDLKILTMCFLIFLQSKLNFFRSIKTKLRAARLRLDQMQRDNQATSELKERIAKLQAELDKDTDDDMFRDFGEVSCMADVEDEVKWASLLGSRLV